MAAGSRPPKWMFGWANRFTDTWGALPAEPILYFFMLLGALQIITSPSTVLSVTMDLPTWVESLWMGASFVGPMLALLAHWLVTRHTGSTRLFGLWMRFAGDFSQAVSLTAFLVMRADSSSAMDDAHIYLMDITTGVLCFVLMLVIRDVWTLVRVEEISADLQRLADAGISIEGLE